MQPDRLAEIRKIEQDPRLLDIPTYLRALLSLQLAEYDERNAQPASAPADKPAKGRKVSDG